MIAAVLQLVPGDLAAPMQPAHPLEAGPGPVGWEVESYRRSFGPERDHGVAMVSYYPGHPETTPGQEWRAYCTSVRPDGSELETWHATAEQAMQAVEAFVAEHAKAGAR